MSNYLSDLGNIPIIDPTNAHLYAEESADGGFSRGYVERDYHRFGEGFYAPRYSGPVFPRSQWDDLIKMHDENQSSPDHWRIKAGVPVLDQNGLGYCWIYGVAGAMMTGYAQTGISVPHLSATSAGAQGKNWRNEGGWAGEAIEYIARFGMAELSVWPEHSMDRSLPNQEAVKRSAAMHDVVEFLELPQQNFDAAVSAILDPINPRAITLGLMWWGHLVYGTKVVKIDRRTYGIKIVNSWRPSWGENGCAVLEESKATAHEYVAVDRCKIRMSA